MNIRKQIGEIYYWHLAFTRRNRAAGTILALLVVAVCLYGIFFTMKKLVFVPPCLYSSCGG
ncbi:MAG: hypothetical protein WCK76_10295 [Elusimicrobiota bacterium]|nr:hypothetical protein [Elusimicrobiota bacterium]